MDIYTPIEEAGKLIRERWADEGLRKMVEERINSNILEIFKDNPSGIIGRCIGTPDGEFERFLELSKKADLKPICLEYTEDKFYHGNFTKYSLVYLPFSIGKDKNSNNIIRKEKIIDFEKIKGKILRMCDLETLWGENLVEFHHSFLLSMFPVMRERVVDTSSWFPKSIDRPKNYTNLVFALSICHCVLFEDFDLLEEEDDFNNEIVLPIFDEIKKHFGVRPIIVKISKAGEHAKDPFWWSYSKESKLIMDNHIKTFK